MRHAFSENTPTGLASVYTFNGKYIIKFEQGMLEQTYKLLEIDLASPEADVRALISNEPFLKKVHQRFQEMAQDLYDVTG